MYPLLAPPVRTPKWSNFSACHGFATRLIHGRTTLFVTGYQEFSSTVSVWLTKNTGSAGNYWIEDRMLDRRRLYSLVCILLVFPAQAVCWWLLSRLWPGPMVCTWPRLAAARSSLPPDTVQRPGRVLDTGPHHHHHHQNTIITYHHFITLFQGIIENLTRRVVGFKRTRRLFILINWNENQRS